MTGQWQMSNSFELFSDTTTYSSFKWFEPLFFKLSCTQIHRRKDKDGKTEKQTDTQTNMSTLLRFINRNFNNVYYIETIRVTYYKVCRISSSKIEVQVEHYFYMYVITFDIK